MLAAIAPLLRFQAISSLFTGRGGFSINKLMRAIMPLMMLPMLMEALNGMNLGL